MFLKELGELSASQMNQGKAPERSPALQWWRGSLWWEDMPVLHTNSLTLEWQDTHSTDRSNCTERQMNPWYMSDFNTSLSETGRKSVRTPLTQTAPSITWPDSDRVCRPQQQNPCHPQDYRKHLQSSAMGPEWRHRKWKRKAFCHWIKLGTSCERVRGRGSQMHRN